LIFYDYEDGDNDFCNVNLAIEEVQSKDHEINVTGYCGSKETEGQLLGMTKKMTDVVKYQERKEYGDIIVYNTINTSEG